MARMNSSGNATFSAKADRDLLDSFDEWVESGDFDNRSEAIRTLMREAVRGPIQTDTPLIPPEDDQLAHAYKRLCDAANKQGVVRSKTAERVCTNGPRNLSKQEVKPLVLTPLRRRGYLFYHGDVYGATAWRIVGWDQ